MTCLIGAYVGDQSSAGGNQFISVGEFESLVGHEIGFHSYFVQFNFQWVAPYKDDKTNQRLPLIAQNAGDLASVASGGQDATLTKIAENLASLDMDILLRYAYEPEGQHYDIPTFKAAWKRYRGILKPIAPKVQMVFCGTARGYRAGNAQKYYPGPDQTDAIGCDGYNRYPTGDKNWRDPTWLFEPWHTWASQLSKPLYICESGSTEDPAVRSRKAAWLSQLAAWLKAHPAVLGWAYEDAYTIHGYDMRLDTTPESLAAYKAIFADPYYATTWPA